MDIKKKFIIFFFLFYAIINNSYCYENKILFKVDNEIITSIDVLKEINYLKALNENLLNIDDKKIYEIAKNSLINSKIKKNEILKYTDNLNVEEKYLNQILKSFYNKQNLNSYEEFKNHLKLFEIEIEDFKKKISIDLIWNDLILAKFIEQVKIDENEIRNEIIQNQSDTINEYLLSELIFDISSINELKTKENLILKDIKEKGFENAVLIHSISNSTAKKGGEIGWVNEESLNKIIRESLINLKIGEITKPIVIPGGFLILKINDIRTIENKNFNLEKRIAEIAQIKKNDQLNNFSNIYFNKIKKEYRIDVQ